MTNRLAIARKLAAQYPGVRVSVDIGAYSDGAKRQIITFRSSLERLLELGLVDQDMVARARARDRDARRRGFATEFGDYVDLRPDPDGRGAWRLLIHTFFEPEDPRGVTTNRMQREFSRIWRNLACEAQPRRKTG